MAGLSLVLPILTTFLLMTGMEYPRRDERLMLTKSSSNWRVVHVVMLLLLCITLYIHDGESFRAVVQSGLSVYQREVLEKTSSAEPLTIAKGPRELSQRGLGAAGHPGRR
jgi:hypothetical protein